jgi:polyphosphate kinase 2 (PPK2 family)
VPDDLDDLWEERFESINEAERHWARNGAVILKFFLNVSQKEQHKRFLDRIEDPAANWKFSAGDFKESAHFEDYMKAYESALRETSKPWAPWYCVPADSKSYMRRVIAETIVDTLAQLSIDYPKVTAEMRAEMDKCRDQLKSNGR